MSKKLAFIAFVVSLGGFLFGFDAGIISGVMSYASPEFQLTELQEGWVVSSPSFAAMIAMLFSGRLSDVFGRKKILLIVAFLYALSALLSAIANSYEILYIARMIGGLAFGAALVLAPMYIAEISTSKNRGKLVAIQQLNIVLGFFAAFLSNYFFNKYNTPESSFLTDENVWRYMLGVELIPALLYFIFLFLVPKSPRWLFLKDKPEEAKLVLIQIHGKITAEEEIAAIEKNVTEKTNTSTLNIKNLFEPGLKFLFFLGLVIGILQQITGINAVYFYATSIFKQTGIGTDASFSSGILLSAVSVIFTIISMYLIDKTGRRSLLLVGTFGIAFSLILCAYGFQKATYQLTTEKINSLTFEDAPKLLPLANTVFTNDLDFKNAAKSYLGNRIYQKNDGTILEVATNINATLVLVGILGFIACFAFSLGPVMWVILSEIYPIKYRGLAIGIIAFINSLISSLVQLVFPWELSNFGNALTFFIFGFIALIGFFVMLKIVPETKGKSLEEIEREFVKA
jgi:sugar porter (SP) family MFS transporter